MCVRVAELWELRAPSNAWLPVEATTPASVGSLCLGQRDLGRWMRLTVSISGLDPERFNWLKLVRVTV